MNPTPHPNPPALQAASRIVKKVRRDHAAHAHAYDGALLGEETHDYLLHPSPSIQTRHLLEFGRPSL